MKLTKHQLKQLIKEELQNVLRSRRRLDEAPGTEALLMQHVDDQLAPLQAEIALLTSAVEVLERKVKVLIGAADRAAMARGAASPLKRALPDPPWVNP